MAQTFNFAITHKDDKTVALKHLIIYSDSQKIAIDFANQEFEEYKNGFLLEPEEFEQIVFSTPQKDNQISYDFAISHKDDPTMALKFITINSDSDSQDIATDFANQAFEEYKDGLLFKLKKYPENLISSKDRTGFAWFPVSFDSTDSAFKDLAEMAETEDWEYRSTPTKYERPILFNYVNYTYKQLAKENKITISKDGCFSCFNTGLVTNNQEPIYALFEANREKDLEPWVFKGWFRHGDHKLTIFSELPDIANYINDPACLYFEPKKDFRISIKHLIENARRERFPEPYKSKTDYALQAAIRRSIDNTRERVRRNYNLAIPCFYRDKIHLLLPLCLKDPKHADLALAIEINKNGYRVTTCLTLSMAYCDARLIAKPNREWLIP